MAVISGYTKVHLKMYLQLLGIFLLLRLVMLDTGWVFFNIPFIDPALHACLNWVHDLFKGLPRRRR